MDASGQFHEAGTRRAHEVECIDDDPIDPDGPQVGAVNGAYRGAGRVGEEARERQVAMPGRKDCRWQDSPGVFGSVHWDTGAGGALRVRR